MALQIEEGRVERYLTLWPASLSPCSVASSSSAIPSPSEASAAPALVISNSGKRIEHHQAGRKKKYVKQVTGRHNDTELHVAARRGDAAAVRRILEGIGAQVAAAAAEGAAAEAEVEAEAAEIREAVVDETNEVGDTPLIAAAERGHLEVVVELLKYADGKGVSRKNRSGFDAFHVAAREGRTGNCRSFL